MKRYEEVAARVKLIAEPIVESLSMELVDVQVAIEHGRRILRVYIDKAGGVTLDDCTDVSKELGVALDVDDPVPDSYDLEVSSPGLDRPLVKEGDYARFAGKKARIRTKAPVDGRKNFKGVIVAGANGAAVIRDQEGKTWELQLSNIEKARLEIEL